MFDKLNVIGLTLDFVGVIVLALYQANTDGCTTKADKDFVASPRWYNLGYSLLAIGFFLQLIKLVFD